MTTPRLSGLFTALATPFKNGEVDYAAFEKFVAWQVSEGVNGIVPCGTTGESPTLSHEEHKRVVETAVKVAAGKVNVMAGTGSNSTAEAIDFSKHAEKAGANSLLVVAPYYNKPTPEGIYQHYKAIHDATGLPIVIYNIPGRSVINIADETLARLAELPRIMGVKDATGDLARVSTLRVRVKESFVQFSGEDMTAIGFNAQGGQGCISVTSNIMPKRCAEIQRLTLEGKYVEALKLHDPMVQLHQAMFCETNPIPVKYALSLMNKMSGEVRLPLVAPAETSQKRLREAMAALKLI